MLERAREIAKQFLIFKNVYCSDLILEACFNNTFIFWDADCPDIFVKVDYKDESWTINILQVVGHTFITN